MATEVTKKCPECGKRLRFRVHYTMNEQKEGSTVCPNCYTTVEKVL